MVTPLYHGDPCFSLNYAICVKFSRCWFAEATGYYNRSVGNLLTPTSYYGCSNEGCKAYYKDISKATGHRIDYSHPLIEKNAGVNSGKNGTLYYRCINEGHNKSIRSEKIEDEDEDDDYEDEDEDGDEDEDENEDEDEDEEDDSSNMYDDGCDYKVYETIFAVKKIKLSQTTYMFNGTARYPAITVTDISGKTVPGQYYKAVYYNNKNVGTATVHLTFSGKYRGTMEKTFTITRATQKISVKISSKTYKKAAVAKSSKSFSIGASAVNKLTYKSSSKYVTVNAKGKVKVKKGTPKGIYKITVSAAKSKNYKAASKTITIKVA